MSTPPPRMELKAVLHPDRQNASLELHMNGSPLGHIILDAASLSQTIETLSAIRAGMDEEVPRELDPGTRLLTVPDPIWQTQRPTDPHAPPDSVLLALRDPGRGWLSFLLPGNEARKLATWLDGNSPKSEAAAP